MARRQPSELRLTGGLVWRTAVVSMNAGYREASEAGRPGRRRPGDQQLGQRVY